MECPYIPQRSWGSPLHSALLNAEMSISVQKRHPYSGNKCKFALRRSAGFPWSVHMFHGNLGDLLEVCLRLKNKA